MKDSLINMGLLAAGGVAIAGASGIYSRRRGSFSRVSIHMLSSENQPVLLSEVVEAAFEKLLHMAQTNHSNTYSVKSFQRGVSRGHPVIFNVISGGQRVSVAFDVDGSYVKASVSGPGTFSSDQIMSFPMSTPMVEAASYLDDLLRSYGASR
jgi:hypothetical protein